MTVNGKPLMGHFNDLDNAKVFVLGVVVSLLAWMALSLITASTDTELLQYRAQEWEQQMPRVQQLPADVMQNRRDLERLEALTKEFITRTELNLQIRNVEQSIAELSRANQIFQQQLVQQLTEVQNELERAGAERTRERAQDQ